MLATAGRNLLSCLQLGDRTGPTDRPDRPVTNKNVGITLSGGALFAT